MVIIVIFMSQLKFQQYSQPGPFAYIISCIQDACSFIKWHLASKFCSDKDHTIRSLFQTWYHILVSYFLQKDQLLERICQQRQEKDSLIVQISDLCYILSRKKDNIFSMKWKHYGYPEFPLMMQAGDHQGQVDINIISQVLGNKEPLDGIIMYQTPCVVSSCESCSSWHAGKIN